jgi:hypothetical protein
MRASNTHAKKRSFINAELASASHSSSKNFCDKPIRLLLLVHILAASLAAKNSVFAAHLQELLFQISS